MRLVHTALLSALLAVGGALQAHADPSTSKEFYEKNYAAAPEVGKKPLAGESVAVPQRRMVPSASSSSGNPSRTNAAGVVPPPNEARTTSRRKRTAIPDTMLALYVNSTDPAHLEAALKKALEVIDRDLVLLSGVYHIGDYRNVPAELERKIAEAGVPMAALRSVPSDFPVSQSPAWVFQGKDGIRIVEGTFAIDQFYDGVGNFQAPQKVVPEPDAEAAAEVTQQMDGF